MKYTVEWRPEAENMLAALWINSKDRRALSAAQACIDKALSEDPLGAGEHVSEGIYGLSEFPLRVLFEINAKINHVKVNSVRLLPPDEE